MNDLYEILQVNKTATDIEIESQYKKLIVKYHPDVSELDNAQEMFEKIQKAYEILSNSEKRKKYDEQGLTDEDDLLISKYNIEFIKTLKSNEDLYLEWINEYWWFTRISWNSDLSEKKWEEFFDEEVIKPAYQQYNRVFKESFNFGVFKGLFNSLLDDFLSKYQKSMDKFNDIIDYKNLNLKNSKNFKSEYVRWDKYLEDDYDIYDINSIKEKIEDIYDKWKSSIKIKQELEKLAWTCFREFNSVYPNTKSFNYYKSAFFDQYVYETINNKTYQEIQGVNLNNGFWNNVKRYGWIIMPIVIPVVIYLIIKIINVVS